MQRWHARGALLRLAIAINPPACDKTKLTENMFKCLRNKTTGGWTQETNNDMTRVTDIQTLEIQKRNRSKTKGPQFTSGFISSGILVVIQWPTKQWWNVLTSAILASFRIHQFQCRFHICLSNIFVGPNALLSHPLKTTLNWTFQGLEENQQWPHWNKTFLSAHAAKPT